MPDYTPIYNQLLKYANKRGRDKILPEEWNFIIRTLALQQNTMSSNLDTVHTQLVNISELDETKLAEILQKLDIHNQQISQIQQDVSNIESGDSHYIGYDTPSSIEYDVWFQIEDEEGVQQVLGELFINTSSNNSDDIFLSDAPSEDVFIVETTEDKFI